MIFPQNHPAGTFEKGGESSFLTLFQNLFLLISPISHFFIFTDSSSLFPLTRFFCCVHDYLHIFSTISTTFSTVFLIPFSHLHISTKLKTDFPTPYTLSFSHAYAIYLISSQIHSLYYYYYFYIFLFLSFFCNFTSFLNPFSETLFISFNQQSPKQPAPLWE